MADPEQPHDPAPQKGLSLSFFALMWVIVLALVAVFFSREIEQRRNPNHTPLSRLDGERVEVVLQRNRQGHFVTTGLVNQLPVEFIVDTGATDVVLGERTAMQAGLQKGAGGFANTANGVITVYRSRIASLRVGDIVLHDVEASINPHMDERSALLGMSFLSQLELLQRGETLTLRQ